MEDFKVYNESKTEILNDYDLDLGYLKTDRIYIVHHEAKEEVQEQSHMEVIAEYPNGGKDVREVIDVPYSPAVPAWDEYEKIKVFIPYDEVAVAFKKNERYENTVEMNIRKKYSLSQELAILRQRDSKSDEYAEYNAYCEECKVKAKREVYKEV